MWIILYQGTSKKTTNTEILVFYNTTGVTLKLGRKSLIEMCVLESII